MAVVSFNCNCMTQMLKPLILICCILMMVTICLLAQDDNQLEQLSAFINVSSFDLDFFSKMTECQERDVALCLDELLLLMREKNVQLWTPQISTSKPEITIYKSFPHLNNPLVIRQIETDCSYHIVDDDSKDHNLKFYEEDSSLHFRFKIFASSCSYRDIKGGASFEVTGEDREFVFNCQVQDNFDDSYFVRCSIPHLDHHRNRLCFNISVVSVLCTPNGDFDHL